MPPIPVFLNWKRSSLSCPSLSLTLSAPPPFVGHVCPRPPRCCSPTPAGSVSRVIVDMLKSTWQGLKILEDFTALRPAPESLFARVPHGNALTLPNTQCFTGQNVCASLAHQGPTSVPGEPGDVRTVSGRPRLPHDSPRAARRGPPSTGTALVWAARLLTSPDFVPKEGGKGQRGG